MIFLIKILMSNYFFPQKKIILPQFLYLQLHILNQPGNVISVHGKFITSKICDMTDKLRSTKQKQTHFKSLPGCV